ncbi:MAG: toll/interleukin-1 receptor domain-containing protein [Promethearchaeota archaeon]
MAKTRTIILNLIIIGIAIAVILIIVDITTNFFGNRDELLRFFSPFLDMESFLSIFNMIFGLSHIPLSIIFSIILIWKRHKIKVYPFVIIIWIYPLLTFLPLFIPIMMGPVDIYEMYTTFYSYLFVSFLTILLPALIVTILAFLFKGKKKERKWERVGEISIRAPTATVSFPLERELIFISYATVDSNYFQIPKITRILTSYPEIDEILYWESDMHDDIYRYMDTNLQRCKVVLLFCSKNSLYSEAVKMEWSSALKLNKRIVPVFENPDDIPALLTTKLGVQFNANDPYSSIEDIYNMILKKLEVESVREFTRYIIPKWIKAEDFYRQLPLEKTVEETLSFESDYPSSELGIHIGLILQNNNFHVPGLKKALKGKKKKKKETSELTEESEFVKFTSFAELRDDPENIAILVKIEKITDDSSNVLLNLKGKRDWVLKEILKDIDLKLVELKSKTELIRNYSGNVISLMKDIDDIERFLRRYLGSSIKSIEELIKQYKNKEIDEEEFIIKGTQSVGKDFIIVFLGNISLILKEKKQILESKPPNQTQIVF